MSSPDKEKVEVVAPASLSGGFDFEAVHEGKTFIVTVPPGGVKKGGRFLASLPSNFYDDEVSDKEEEETKEKEESEPLKQREESSVPPLPPPPGVASVGGQWGEERFVPEIAASSCGCFAFAFASRSRPKEETRTVYETLDGKRYDAEGRETAGGYDFEPFAPKEG